MKDLAKLKETYKKLGAEIAELEYKPEWPSVGDTYYYLFSCGVANVNRWAGDGIDVSRANIGNMFKTAEEAQAESAKRKAIVRVSNAVNELNATVMEDSNESWTVRSWGSGDLEACDLRPKSTVPLSIPTCLTHEGASSIIKTHAADLKLILGVK